MKMAQLVEMLKERQKREGIKSDEAYANRIGIRGSTLWRYYNADRGMNLKVIRILARYFQSKGDEEMVSALKDYAVFGEDTDGIASLPN